jgi:hypothetical protein
MKVVLPRINTPSMDTTYWCTMINARLKGQCIYLLNFLFIMEKYIESNKYLENLHSHSKKGGSDDTSNGSTHRVAQRPPSMCWIEDVKSSWRGIVTSVYHYGETVYVSCQTGYHMKGDRHISCMQPWQWNPTMPTCDGKHISSSMYLIKLIDVCMHFEKLMNLSNINLFLPFLAISMIEKPRVFSEALFSQCL